MLENDFGMENDPEENNNDKENDEKEQDNDNNNNNNNKLHSKRVISIINLRIGIFILDSDLKQFNST